MAPAAESRWCSSCTADTVSPIARGYSRHRGPNGELRGRTLSLDETAGFCTTEFSSRTTASGGVGGTAVAAWTVFGGGHAWPGSALAPGSTQEFDAAEEICFAEPLLVSADTRRL